MLDGHIDKRCLLLFQPDYFHHRSKHSDHLQIYLLIHNSLQTNFYLDHEASADEAPPPVLCDMCDEGNRQHAAHACQQCQKCMCSTCRRYHDKFMPDHHVTCLSLDQQVKNRGEKTNLCPSLINPMLSVDVKHHVCLH